MNTELISEDWLKQNGFKWHMHDRQPSKHWLLWLGDAVEGRNMSYEDLGIELAQCSGDKRDWFCWLRSDVAGRYHRFIHVRHLQRTQEVIDLVAALTGVPWLPTNHIYGSVVSDQRAARIRADEQRLDRVIMRECAKWSEVEKDDTRGRALPDHMEEARVFEKPLRKN